MCVDIIINLALLSSNGLVGTRRVYTSYSGLAVDANGVVYVCDCNNDRIQIFCVCAYLM